MVTSCERRAGFCRLGDVVLIAGILVVRDETPAGYGYAVYLAWCAERAVNAAPFGEAGWRHAACRARELVIGV